MAARRAAGFARFYPGLRHPGPPLFGHLGSSLLKLPGLADGSEEQAALVKHIAAGLSMKESVAGHDFANDANAVWDLVKTGGKANFGVLRPEVVQLLGLRDAGDKIERLAATLGIAEITSAEILAEYLASALAGAGERSDVSPQLTPLPMTGLAKGVRTQSRATAAKPSPKSKPAGAATKTKVRQASIPAGPLGKDRIARQKRDSRSPVSKGATTSPVPALPPTLTLSEAVGQVPPAAPPKPSPVQASSILPVAALPPTTGPASSLPGTIGPQPPASPRAARLAQNGAARPSPSPAPVEFIALGPPTGAPARPEARTVKPTAYEKALRFLKRLGK